MIGNHGTGFCIHTGFFCKKTTIFCNKRFSIKDVYGKRPDFSAKRKIFLQIHRNTLENSKVHPIRRLARRTETYPILETFLFLFTTRRFVGVGAPEGREKVPDHIFPQNKKKSKFVFLAEDYGWMTTRFFRKIRENGAANL
jgi:hypothetical protein